MDRPSLDPRHGIPRFRPSLGVRRLIWRARRPAAAILSAVAVLMVAQVLRSPGPPRTAVVVAADDLPAGTVLTADDLTTRALTTATLPTGTHTASDGLIGSRTAVPLPAGLPLVDGLLIGPDATVTGPPGTVVVPARFADPAAAALLAAGRRIDVVAVDPGSAPRTVATGALVLAAPETSATDTSGSVDSPGPVLLAVDPEQAVDLSAASTSHALAAVLVE
ncbi:SAF domain-containing protein [Cellulomonas sp. NPDC089187]|uniref:SAF domain-containing protein n=1 Tax=Cellulomonas sp. NPDC089187 TaxID=3154970 RepID=UPI00342ADA66